MPRGRRTGHHRHRPCFGKQCARRTPKRPAASRRSSEFRLPYVPCHRLWHRSPEAARGLGGRARREPVRHGKHPHPGQVWGGDGRVDQRARYPWQWRQIPPRDISQQIYGSWFLFVSRNRRSSRARAAYCSMKRRRSSAIVRPGGNQAGTGSRIPGSPVAANPATGCPATACGKRS